MTGLSHYCTGCGEIHGGPGGKSPEVEIAKINAERDIEVARLARAAVKLETEAQVEAAEVVADAEVEQTEIQAAAVVEVGEIPEPEPEPEPAPVIVEAAEPEEESGPESPAEISGNTPGENTRRGYWDAYSA